VNDSGRNNISIIVNEKKPNILLTWYQICESKTAKYFFK